jgi:hypothetical protein
VRLVEAGAARIRSATLSWRRGRWHVALSVELPDPVPPELADGGVVRVVGVDLAALAGQAVHGELRRDVKLPAGNPVETAIGGNGYRHGKIAISRQRRPARGGSMRRFDERER